MHQFALEGVTGIFALFFILVFSRMFASLLLIVFTVRHNSLTIDLLP